MGNRFTTPGGFAPTPSTCYPWPPWGPQSWPIPCLQGPIPSIVNVDGHIHFDYVPHDSAPDTIDAGGSGIATLGSGNGYTALSANLANGNMLQLDIALLCVELGAGGYEWQGQLTHRWLSPEGLILTAHFGPTPDGITDNSVPGNYNLINWNWATNLGVNGNWMGTALSARWYTPGAPL